MSQPRDDTTRLDDEQRATDSTAHDAETHATTGGAAAAGAVTGGVIGLAGGPVGAAIGAVGGAIVGAAAERMMHSDDDAERAQAGLDNDRDRNPLIEDRAEASKATGAPETTTSRSDIGVDEMGGTMRLREEELHARKQPVETGQVSLGKEVVEEQRTMEVPVTREEAYVERHPVERRPSEQPIEATAGQTIDTPVREEHVEVSKQPVVYEEVGVGKRQVTETQQVSDTVRREELRVEREGDARVSGATTAGSWEEAMPRYRERWQQRYGVSGERWEDHAASYRYGWELRSRPEYRGRSWSEVESQAQRDWTVRNPGTPWEQARESIRDAWETSAT
jgi:uncharacterized protein (TIGR02271 family)